MPCRKCLRLLFLSAILFTANYVAGQTFPVRPVRIVVSATAGGFMDLMTRGLAQQLNTAWNQAIIVENRPGANGIVATEFVAKATPDGHVILFATSSLATNEFLYNSLPFDASRDLAPVVGVAAASMVLVCSSSLGASTLRQIIELAKQKPGAINYGSFGVGNVVSHIDMEAFATLAGIKLMHIPYKGVPDVTQAIISGQVHLGFFGVAAAVAQARGGQLKLVAVAAGERLNVIPNVATFAESGVPFQSRGWYGLVVPAGTPKSTVDQIARDVIRVASASDYQKQYLIGQGIEPMLLKTDEFAALIKEERATYRFRIANVGVKLD